MPSMRRALAPHPLAETFHVVTRHIPHPASSSASRVATSRRRRSIPLAIALCAVLCGALGCKTPDGPRLPIPEQDVAIEVPPGLTRVVFINTDYGGSTFGSGPIRIQLDGKQIPSVWPERFIQTFLAPGEYDLLLEHSFGFFWKRRGEIVVEDEPLLIAVFKPAFGFGPDYDFIDELPSDFESAFTPGRHPKSW